MQLFKFDEEIKANRFLIGCDEAGRGPGAGAVFAAAVCFKEIDKSLMKNLSKLNDSKQLNEKIREELFKIITQNSVYAISFCSVEEIEKINILQASLLAMKKSVIKVVEELNNKENINIIIDGNKLIPKLDYDQQFIIKGDGKSASIAAASILAKVSRDKYMIELDKQYPEYNWKKNKGYLTKAHLDAVDKYGLTPYHRKQFFNKHFSKQINMFE